MVVRSIAQAGAKAVGDLLEPLGEKTSAKVWSGTAPEETVTTLKDGSVVIKSLADEEVEALNAAIKDSGYKGPKINWGLDVKRIGELISMTGEDSTQGVADLLQTIKGRNKELFKHFKREQKSIEQLAKMAEKTGVDVAIHKFLGRKPGTKQPLPLPEDVLAGIIGLIRLGSELELGTKLLLKTNEEEQTRIIFEQIAQTSAIASHLSASISGVVSEYARGMAVVRNIAKLKDFNLTAYTEQLDQYIQGYKENTIDFDTISVEDMRLRALQFTRLPSPGKANYAGKAWYAKTYDVAMEIYVNSLLAGGGTHAVNITGNGMFQGLTLAERGLAAQIGGVRQTVARTLGREVDPNDRVMIGEATQEAYAMWAALGDAFTLMGRTLVTGESGDFASKIDLRNLRAIGNEDNIATIFQNMGKGDFFHSAIDALGVMARSSGRFLASEDEFYKVISRRRVLHREAFRRATIEQQNFLKSRGKRDPKAVGSPFTDTMTANDVYKEVYQSILDNPPADVLEAMDLYAKEMTFQTDLEGWQLNAQKAVSNPLLKPTFVFVKTPTNVVNQVFNRTFNWSPIMRALQKEVLPKTVGSDVSGRELDEAMAKLSIGWGTFGIIYAMTSGYFGEDNIKFNGGGPPTFQGKGRARDQGVQPYSIQYKDENGNMKTTTFSRLDPLSGILAIATDMATVMKNAPDDEGTLKELQTMFTAGVLATAEYAGELPFLQGVSELSRAMMNPSGDTANMLERLLKFGSKKAGDIVMNVGGAVEGRMSFGMIGAATDYLAAEGYDVPHFGSTSFSATMERLVSQDASNTMMEDTSFLGWEYQDIPAPILGYLDAVQKSKARITRSSAELPPGLDYWGNVKPQGSGNAWEMISPFKTREVRYNSIDDELSRLAYNTNRAIKFHSKDMIIQGERVRLNAGEFNKYIGYFNQVDSNGLLPDDQGYNDMSIKEELLELIGGDKQVKTTIRRGNQAIADFKYYDELNDDEKFEQISAVMSSYGSLAKGLLSESEDYSSGRLYELFLNEE